MKVTIAETGYVGLVTGACLAEVGNEVVCLNVDEKKIRMLNNGEVPIFEPGLEAMVNKCEAAGHLKEEKGIRVTPHQSRVTRHG